jgi:glycosyltransferase involved in cell wall biosynthesis
MCGLIFGSPDFAGAQKGTESLTMAQAAPGAKAKRVMLITSWFPADVGRRGLFNEFADAVAATGATIDVIAIDWRDVDLIRNTTKIHEGERQNIYRFSPFIVKGFGRGVGIIAKWIGTSMKAASKTFGLMRQNDYDVVVSFAPSAVWAPVLVASLFPKVPRYLIQWDFVPYHQRAVGMMPSKLTFSVLLWLENFLMRRFDRIGCMSPMNIDFLKRHYKLKSNQKIEVLPIWGEAVFPAYKPKDDLRETFGLPLDRTIAVFGGTLSKGRGTEDIIEAAKIAEVKNSNVLFLIVGSGPIEDEVRKAAAGLRTVRVMSTLPRQHYQLLLEACDCGIVATERDSGMPTFPSKTMDYFRAGTPVVASVEPSTDYGLFLTEHEAGIHVMAGDHAALLSAVERIGSEIDLRNRLIENGRRLMTYHFNVLKIIEQVTG